MRTLTRQEEKRLRLLIARNRTNERFPKPEDFDTTEEELDDYLYLLNPQRDLMAEQKKQLTVMGILLIVPIGALSVFLRQEMALLLGAAVGLMLCVGYHFLTKAARQRRLQRLADSGVEDYINAVMAADPEKENPAF